MKQAVGGTKARSPSRRRDVEAPATSSRQRGVSAGRLHLVTIGINDYQNVGRLKNAVGDAEGALKAFSAVGFESRAHLTDKEATHAAMHRLVREDLQSLDKEDSLVVFFAGHGYTHSQEFADTSCIKTGYLMPVDGESKRPGTCVRIRTWLDEIAHLPPKHILIILDACKSGIALEPMMQWHPSVAHAAVPRPLDRLRQRRSRRVFTSALDDEYASDRGPHAGNSLFTGYLIEALGNKPIPGLDGTPASTMSNYVRDHVMAYSKSRQTPGFGALQLDDQGDLIIAAPLTPVAPVAEGAKGEVVPTSDEHARGKDPGSGRSERSKKEEKGGKAGANGKAGEKTAAEKKVTTKRGKGKSSATSLTRSVEIEEEDELEREDELDVELPPRPARLDRAPWQLREGAGFLAAQLISGLDRHAAHRKQGSPILTTIAGEPQDAAAAIATYHAQRGALTLMTSATAVDAAVAEVLAYLPWPRCLPAARTVLCRAAKIDPSSLEAHLEARGERERRQWIDDLSAGNPAVRVAGWLLTHTRSPGEPYDLSTAPVQGRELLTALGDLLCPIAVLVQHEDPTAEWLQGAVGVAASLTGYLPWHSVSICAPAELLAQVLEGGRDSAAKTMARQGRIHGKMRLGVAGANAPLAVDEVALQERLFAAIERDPRSKGRFERRVFAPIHERERQVEVLLAARSECLLVEVDRWYHVREPDAYRKTRLKDIWLQRAGFLSLRFPAEDLEQRMSSAVDEICAALAGRRDEALFI